MSAQDLEQRAQFEEWVRKRHGLSVEVWDDSGKYKYGNTHHFWECWKVAAALRQQPAPVLDDELPGMWSQSDFMGGATDAADNARQPAPVAGDAMAGVLAALKDARTFVTHAHCQIAAPIGTLEKYDAATAAVNELIEVAAQIKARLDARRAKAFAERGGWQWHSREDEGDYERLCAALARAQGVQS